MQEQAAGEEPPTGLEERINQVLTETRVVIPGSQALLGFQFIAMFTDSFAMLEPAQKAVHLASLALIALSAMMLMAPAAYHRIVDLGEESEQLHSFASAMLLGAMAVLGLGLAGDFWLVVDKITGSGVEGGVGASLLLLCTYGLWFGYTAFVRRQRPQSNTRQSRLAAKTQPTG